MYQAARGWGIQPSEFWGMTFAEWLAEAEMAIERADNMPLEGHRKLTPKRARELAADLDLSDAEWLEKQRGNTSG